MTSIEPSTSTRPHHARRVAESLSTTHDAPELQKLGRTIRTWFDKICNFHLARVSNGPTESINNLIKRIKRVGFGFRNFENYRIRALLYAANQTGGSSARSWCDEAHPVRIA